MVANCKECSGTGVVAFTKERGGPVCQNCNGAGRITPEGATMIIARILDGSSVYMGGPSHQSRRNAKKIVEYLVDQGLV